MEINGALLADFAQVREGLLMVASGGVTRLVRPAFPAPMNVFVVVMLGVNATELSRAHEIDFGIESIDGAIVGHAKAGIAITVAPAGLDPGEGLQVPVVADLRNAALPGPGTYVVTIAVDGQMERSLSFKVLPLPGPGALPSA